MKNLVPLFTIAARPAFAHGDGDQNSRCLAAGKPVLGTSLAALVAITSLSPLFRVQS